jgi:23S rRNA (guanosine2251-2'-O)-methyltransferase
VAVQGNASTVERPLAPVTELYGVAPVLEALRAGRRNVEAVTIAEGVRHHRLNELIAVARAKGIVLRQAPRSALDRATANANHQGVVARVSAARYANAEELLDQIELAAQSTDPPLVVVLDGVEDPRNFGAILRTAECAGAQAVFIPERRAVGLTETVAKAAAGALEHLPVARVGNLTRLIDELKERSVWTVGTSAEANLNYTEWDWTTPTAVFFGGEGGGLHRLVRERCDALVSIPILGKIESLNVSVAAGIVMYEALRQRQGVKRQTSAAVQQVSEA